MDPVETDAAGEPLVIQFVHAAVTPHNNYLLDEIARSPGVELHRHYMFGPKSVPGRPWKQMSSGDVQARLVRDHLGTWFDSNLLRLALFDRKSVFFVIGWEYPILVWLLVLIGLRKRPLIMWDDGPSPQALEAFARHRWRPRQVMKRFLVALINRTDGAYFCTGRHALQDVRRLGVRREKLISLPFFVREGVAQPALRTDHGCAEPCVLIVAGGRLVQDKGYDLFIEALARLKVTQPAGWKAVLIGSGPEADALHALAAERGLAEELDFLAWAEPDKFANYMHTCDIFVAPARFDHFPTTVIAAMQAGVAVVASDAVGSAVEFVEPGLSGMLVPAGDANALADAIGELVSDPEGRSRIASAGQETMREWPVERGARMIVEAAREAKRCAA